MNYTDVEARYRALKAQVAAGVLPEDDFKAQLEELMIQDDGGRWWIIGYETGDWYVFDGQEWTQAAPPAPVLSVEPTPEIPVESAAPAPERPSESHEPLPIVELPAGEPPVELPLRSVAAASAGVFTGLHVAPAPAAPWPAATWPHWAPVAIIAAGWGVGLMIVALIGTNDSEMVPVGLALAFILGGVAAAFVCRREGIALRWYHVLVLLLISPWLMGLVLRWAETRFRWGQVAILFAAWALAAGIGLGVVFLFSLGSYSDSRVVLSFTVWGLVTGALGGWATVDQLARARRAAASVG